MSIKDPQKNVQLHHHHPEKNSFRNKIGEKGTSAEMFNEAGDVGENTPPRLGNSEENPDTFQLLRFHSLKGHF